MNTWDDKFDYLKLTRSLYLNVDYLQFLVEKVWKITKKVVVVDFGCGYGYLGHPRTFSGRNLRTLHKKLRRNFYLNVQKQNRCKKGFSNDSPLYGINYH